MATHGHLGAWTRWKDLGWKRDQAAVRKTKEEGGGRTGMVIAVIVGEESKRQGAVNR